jgi:hypothetical protein
VDQQPSSASRSGLSLQGFVVSCALLAAAIFPAALVVSWLVSGRLSASALTSAAVGGSVCFLAAALALTTTYLANRFEAPVQGVLVAMLFRMGLPLAALIVLPKVGGPWATPGVTSTILGVYFVALVLETLLSLKMVAPRPNALKAAC